MLSFIMVLFLMGDAQAQSKLNTNLYEQEPERDKTKSFAAKVRVVREISDEVEVFFEGDKAKGAYTLPRSAQHYGKMLKDLEKSKKAGGPSVKVTADEDKRIKSVEINESGDTRVPADPNKPWDFGKPE
ncbi:hypothetical protein QJS83_07245 [Bdellovibrio sp. 22V]|uniref:hypothetical protein n=1 Tax=Bdellovibrio TaxID=958 RepID=UPI0025428477|nr:hypothetical protein [Bdellovibrio sp. 22V]WII73668.1 hypothetical protein QJS83_07245 [Bdellovibrio sp. 22V]